jgi:hypothetical protein
MRLRWLSASALCGAAKVAVVVMAWAAMSPSNARAEVRLYGFAQLDYTQDFNRVDPDWEDSLRPSKIPTSDDQFGDDGNAVLSIRQSRLGAEATTQAGDHELRVRLEFDFYGVGDNAGQVTPRFRHGYGEWGQFLIGQTNSVFMDIDIFPNTVEYWGPNGMVFVRKPQIRWTFLNSDHHRAAVALEDPGSDIDPGNVRELDPDIGANIVPSEQYPDLTGHYRYTGGWGYVQAAGILRNIGYETLGTPDNEPADDMMGWGINLTSNIRVGERSKFLLGVVFGEGIASYMNDGGVDIAPDGVPGDLEGEAAPLWGLSVYYDHYWSDRLSSSIGYSQVDLDNQSFQSGDAFHLGQYASVNLLYTPADNLLFGAEALWGRREDFDGADGDDFRIQFTAKYSFSETF